jgi:hypothetical protein
MVQGISHRGGERLSTHGRSHSTPRVLSTPGIHKQCLPRSLWPPRHLERSVGPTAARRRPALRAAKLRAFRASDLSCAGKGSRAASYTLRGRPAQTRFTVPSISSPQAVSAIERRRFFALSWLHSHVSILYSRCRRLCPGSLLAPGAPRAHPPVGQIRSATGLRLDLCSCVVQQTSSSRFLNAAPLRKDASPSSRSSL